MKVLVVDDQKEVVQAVVSGVHWEKIQVEQVFSAYSVKEAMRLFLQEDIQILLCDIEMPPTNGFTLLRFAQTHKPDIACIFLSAHAEFAYALEAVKLGSYDYILQPAPFEEIEQAVQKAVHKVREAQRLQRYYDFEDYREGEPGAESQEGERMPVQRAMDYIRCNISRDLSRTEIAEAIFLSPEYLSHLFKKETGSSLSEYIVTEKMRLAQQLLRDSSMQISEVAQKVGYSNFSYFSQVFKKHLGLSPVEYRNQQR